MSETHGYEVVIQATRTFLEHIAVLAWKAGGDESGFGVIPQTFQLPAGTAVGPFRLADGTVQILPDTISLNMNTVIQGASLGLVTAIQLVIADPPVPAARLFNLRAWVLIHTPIRGGTNPARLRLDFTALPANAVEVTLMSGDPLRPILDVAAEQFFRQQFHAPDSRLPHTISDIPIELPSFQMRMAIQLFDDEADPQRRISVRRLGANQVEFLVPCYLRFYNITGGIGMLRLATPMGATGNLRILARLVETEHSVAVHFAEAEVDLVDLRPAPGVEGENYTTNAATIEKARSIDPRFPSLEGAIRTPFRTILTPLVRKLPDEGLTLPTVKEIEARMAQALRDQLAARHEIELWHPEAQDQSAFAIRDLQPRVLSNAIAIAINAKADADPNALSTFIPVGQAFAIALDQHFITEAFAKARDQQFPSFPYRLDPSQTNGHDIDLDSLNLQLVDDALEISGHVTAIIDYLPDVGATFRQKIGLRWKDQPEGGQTIETFLIGDSDVDVEVGILTFLVTFLVGFFTLGLMSGVIATVALAIAEQIAQSIGSARMHDAAAGRLAAIRAWPADLPSIGRVDGRFVNPIRITPAELQISGELTATSTYAGTAIDFANAQGPFRFHVGQPAGLTGGLVQQTSQALWSTGDGAHLAERNPTHRYERSGQYLATLQVRVAEPGGTTTRSFATVEVANEPPVAQVTAPAQIVEWQSVTVSGVLRDLEREGVSAWIDFGDNTAPERVPVTLERDTSGTRGAVKATHLYSTAGTYQVRLRAEDADGGIGEAVSAITVEMIPRGLWDKVSAGRAVLGATVSAVASGDGRFDLFLVGLDRRIYTAAWDGVWSEWNSIGTGTAPDGAQITPIRRKPDRIDLFVVGDNGAIYTNWWDGVWQNWQPVGDGTAPTGSAVTALSRDGATMDLAVVGDNERIYTAHFAGDWSPWEPIGEGTAPLRSPITAVTSPQRVALYIVGNNGQVHESVWANGWHQWTPIGNLVAPPRTPITAVNTAPGRIDLFLVGEDSAIYTNTWRGVWGAWTQVGHDLLAPCSPIAAVATMPNSISLYIIAGDGRVVTASLWEERWSEWEPLGLGSAPLRSPITPVMLRDYEGLLLVVIGDDGFVYAARG